MGSKPKEILFRVTDLCAKKKKNNVLREERWCLTCLNATWNTTDWGGRRSWPFAYHVGVQAAARTLRRASIIHSPALFLYASLLVSSSLPITLFFAPFQSLRSLSSHHPYFNDDRGGALVLFIFLYGGDFGYTGKIKAFDDTSRDQVWQAYRLKGIEDNLFFSLKKKDLHV